jgi:hypothetical protein
LTSAVKGIAYINKLAKKGVDKTYSYYIINKARDYSLNFYSSIRGPGVNRARLASLARLKTAKVKELKAEFASAKAHVISLEELEADCLCAVVLAFAKTNSRFVLDICAVFKANKSCVNLICYYKA